MDLFESLGNSDQNLLPFDGEVIYWGNILPGQQADYLFNKLLREVPWENDQVKLYGKHIVTRRKIALYGNLPYQYEYSNHTNTAKQWTPLLSNIKRKIESLTNETFNACLLNYYENGEVGIALHSDNETALAPQHAIASLSLGASRDFIFKHKISGEKVGLRLGNGSLLIMRGETQKHWLHSLPVRKRVKQARINLTFRAIVNKSSSASRRL